MLAADAAAHRAGLRVGMPATKAQALVFGLIVKDAEPTADAEALDRLALWALQRYSPMVAADPPDGVVIDTTGAAHLHGGEAAMIEEMVARLAANGIAGRAALADSWGAAFAFARFVAQPTLVLPPGESATAVLDLPVAALRLPLDMVASLRVLVVHRGQQWPRPRLRQSRRPAALAVGHPLPPGERRRLFDPSFVHRSGRNPICRRPTHHSQRDRGGHYSSRSSQHGPIPPPMPAVSREAIAAISGISSPVASWWFPRKAPYAVCLPRCSTITRVSSTIHPHGMRPCSRASLRRR